MLISQAVHTRKSHGGGMIWREERRALKKTPLDGPKTFARKEPFSYFYTDSLFAHFFFAAPPPLGIWRMKTFSSLSSALFPSPREASLFSGPSWDRRHLLLLLSPTVFCREIRGERCSLTPFLTHLHAHAAQYFSTKCSVFIGNNSYREKRRASVCLTACCTIATMTV